MPDRQCGCGKPATRQCVECELEACAECATDWQGNICSRCQSENPVFYDKHSRTHGDVSPREGEIR
jgi:hypothetical protein